MRQSKLICTLAVLPSFIIVAGFMAFPILFAVFISFTKTNGLTFKCIWFENYISLFADPVVHEVFLNNFKFLISVPMVIFVALVSAILLFEQFKGWKFFRVIFFLPSVLSVVVIGLIFRNAFGYYGSVNQFLGLFGMEPRQFFINSNYSIFIIILALVWSGFGYQSLLLLAGLTSINPAVFEAAAIDGASPRQIFARITLPLLLKIVTPLLIASFAFNFNNFNLIYLLTGGGPRNELDGQIAGATDILISYTYKIAFGSNIQDLGLASAISVIIFIIIASISLYGVRKSKVLDSFS